MTESKLWTDSAEQLADMRKHLEATRKDLDSDRQYRQARKDMCDALLREAEHYIRTAAGILERNPDLKGGDSLVAFKACLRVAFRDMQLALRDPAVVIGTRAWERQVERGHKGADKRWGDRNELNELYAKYALRRDGLLDLSLPGDIYESFAGDCRDAGIEPPEKKTFRNRLAEVRSELRMK